MWWPSGLHEAFVASPSPEVSISLSLPSRFMRQTCGYCLDRPAVARAEVKRISPPVFGFTRGSVSIAFTLERRVISLPSRFAIQSCAQSSILAENMSFFPSGVNSGAETSDDFRLEKFRRRPVSVEKI